MRISMSMGASVSVSMSLGVVMSVGVSMSVGMSVSTSVWEHERPPARTVEPKMSATMPE